MIGIYKITSPTGKVYIGQSWNIYKRWKAHKNNKQKSKLNSSFKSHGVKAHQFEIIHLLPDDVTQNVLDRYEQFYMDAYSNCGIKLLNCREAGSRGRHSEEARKIISEKGKGRKISDENKEKLRIRMLGKKTGLGYKHTEEWKQNMSSKMSGRTHSDEHKKNNSEAKKGEKCYMYGIESNKHPLAKKIRCERTGVIYGSVIEAAKTIGLKRTTLVMQLRGYNVNKTGLVYDTQ